MFTNASQAPVGAALGAHAFIFNSMQSAGAVCDGASSYCDSPATSGSGLQKFSIGRPSLNRVWFIKSPPPPPPGGGARRPGAPGAPSGGGSNGGRGPKKRVTTRDVFVALQQLDMKRPNVSLLPEELEYLEREGLIERMSGSDYDRHERSLLRVDLLNDDLRAAREEQSSLGRSRSKLLLKHKSRRHQLFSRAKTLAKEEAELKRSKGRLQEIAESIQRINEELGTLETTKKYLATFVRTPYGYMRLSRKGDELLEALRNSDGK